MSNKKLILVIGATGAQGTAVINALLGPIDDGSPSPYAVRALTRDPNSRRAKELSAQGVECVKGTFHDLSSVAAAFEGVYGAWVNTDGFTVGEEKETYLGIKIFEIAKRTPSVRHYVWSSLDYATKKGGYNPDYKVEHFDGKGRVADFLKAQSSVPSDADLSWSCVTTGPYMDMLNILMFGPLTKREDGTFVFASPVGNGHVPMIALSDIGFWARYTFDHRAETSAKDLEVTSDRVGWDYLVKTFTKVTGHPAVYVRQTLDEWWNNFTDADRPIASDKREGKEAGALTTIRENFSGFWRLWRDDIIKRDMNWIRSVHPETHSLEQWMLETEYTGKMDLGLLKNGEDGKGSFRPNWEKISLL